MKVEALVKLRNALLATALATAALSAAATPAVAKRPHVQTRWQLAVIGKGQPDCLTSLHAIGRPRGYVISSRRAYAATFLIDIGSLPRGWVDVYVSSVSGDGYGGNSDYGGFGACPQKRIKLGTVRTRHGHALLVATTSWLPIDAAVYVSAKPAGSKATWNLATSSVFFP
jgi:hypothetical protein